MMKLLLLPLVAVAIWYALPPPGPPAARALYAQIDVQEVAERMKVHGIWWCEYDWERVTFERGGEVCNL